MSGPISTSANFGGSKSNGDVTANPGFDAIIPVGGNGPETYQIRRIIAQYAFAGVVDFQSPALPAHRSLTGRVLIIEGAVNQNLTDGAVTPNPVLFSIPPEFGGRIRFDKLIHSFDKPIIFDFTEGMGLGLLLTPPGTALTVVMVAGQTWQQGNPTPTYSTIQMLQVQAELVSQETLFAEGNYRATS